MKNTNFAPEIASANRFVIEHNNDIDFMTFLRKMEEANISHSTRWSEVYDYMYEHYPEATGSLVTGLVYWIEA